MFQDFVESLIDKDNRAESWFELVIGSGTRIGPTAPVHPHVQFGSQRHGDTEAQSEFAVNNPGDAILHERLAEIQQVAKLQASQSEIR